MTAKNSVLVGQKDRSDLPKIIPETGVIGASVIGMDLGAEQPPEVEAALVRALHEHGVLFIRSGVDLSVDDHLRIARIFGENSGGYFSSKPGSPVSVLDSETTGSAKFGTDQWHTDLSIFEEPPLAASLRALILPEVGGDTMWASMYAAYERLSPSIQRLIDGLEAVHSSTTLEAARPAAREANLFGELRTAVHPMVIRDPVTDKPALYVNQGYTERVVGLSANESQSLLKMLFDHVNTPDFHVRLKWDTRTIVVWEERVTQHRGINDYVGRRVLNRINIRGGRPEAYGTITRD